MFDSSIQKYFRRRRKKIWKNRNKLNCLNSERLILIKSLLDSSIEKYVQKKTEKDLRKIEKEMIWINKRTKKRSTKNKRTIDKQLKKQAKEQLKKKQNSANVTRD